MRVLVRGLAAAIVLTFASRLEAQQYFGTNQVQYKHFTWRVLETEHFLVSRRFLNNRVAMLEELFKESE